MLESEVHGAIVHSRLSRPEKCNAINDELLAQVHSAFTNLPRSVCVAVISPCHALPTRLRPTACVSSR